MGGAVEQTKEIYLGRNLVDIEKVKKISGVFFLYKEKYPKTYPCYAHCWKLSALEITFPHQATIAS
jgi:hypothetical protein